MFDLILVICTGNICRSPIGERLLRRLLPSKRIDSAGVGALVNHAADESAIRVAEKYGLSLDGHRGAKFTSALARQYDLLLVMEARGKTMLFGHWLDSKEIPDPYRMSDEAFDSVYQLLEQASKRWADKLGE